jgi:hypothetical protein
MISSHREMNSFYNSLKSRSIQLPINDGITVATIPHSTPLAGLPGLASLAGWLKRFSISRFCCAAV